MKRRIWFEFSKVGPTRCQLVDSTKEGIMVHNGSESSFVVDVKYKKVLDPIMVQL